MNVAALLLPLVVPLHPLPGAWDWPLPPPHHVVRGFDPPVQPWLAGHRGVDLAGADGEPVLAAGDGVVAFAGRIAGVPIVSVQHPDGLRTTYLPVVTRRKPGTAVRRGEQIGHLVLGGSHCAPAPCLHWGLKRGQDYLDPLALLRLNPVRLLPLGQEPTAANRVPVVGSAAAGLALSGGGLATTRLSRRRRSCSARQRRKRPRSAPS